MTEMRADLRSLCADLVELEWKDKSGWVRLVPAVLEDISPRGACLQLEYPVPVNMDVILHHPEPWSVRCRTSYCSYREIGYFVGLEFQDGTRWSRRAFRPQHLLDLEDLITHAARPE